MTHIFVKNIKQMQDLKFGMGVAEVTDNRDKFAIHVKENLINISALARRVGVSPSFLWYIFNKKRNLSEELRINLNNALKTRY
jgi:hypothetical protein